MQEFKLISAQQEKKEVTEAVILLLIALVSPIILSGLSYASLLIHMVLCLYAIVRCKFLVIPAIVAIYAHSSSIVIAVLVSISAIVAFKELRGDIRQVLRFPDILIFPMLVIVGSMTLAACDQNGYYWNEAHWAELWSVLGLFAFYFGMLLYKTASKKVMSLIYLAGLAPIFVELMYRQSDGFEEAYSRTVFYWGPFYVLLLAYGVLKRKPTEVAFGIIGSLAFLGMMVVGLPTMTLQGITVYALSLYIMYPYRFVLMQLLGLVLAAWPIYIVVFMALVYGISNVDSWSVSRDYGGKEGEYTYSFASTDTKFVEMLRRKMFDDRAMLWRAVWNDVTTPPYFWRSTAIRTIPVLENSLGQELFDVDLSPHSVYIGILFHMRWVAGCMFLIVYCTMVMRGGKLLLLKTEKGVWQIFSAMTIAVGVFGSFTGMFPVMMTFNVPFMTLAGLSYARYLDVTNQNKNRVRL